MSKDFIMKFEHNLAQSFEYANKGLQAQATKITVNAPTNQVMQFVSLIETEFNRSTIELSKQFKDEKEKEDKLKNEMNEEERRNTIYTVVSSFADLNKCLLALRSILTTKGMAYIDDVTPVTIPMFDNMAMADTREILISYILNFLNTSLNS